MVEEHIDTIVVDGIKVMFKPETLSPMEAEATGNRRANALMEAYKRRLPQEVLIDGVRYFGDDSQGARVIVPFRLHVPTKQEVASVALDFTGFLRWYLHNDDLMARDASYGINSQFLVGEEDILKGPLYTLKGNVNQVMIYPHGKIKEFDDNLFEYPVYVKHFERDRLAS